MLPPFRIFRVSNVLKEGIISHIEEMREVVAKSRRLLDDREVPDTFAGRKTHEPFPEDHEF